MARRKGRPRDGAPLDALTDSARDPGVTSELTGIDYPIVDEAHGYQNLRTMSNIAGVGIDGSQRASDLDMKISYLRERHGTRVATFATATPIANSLSGAYVRQRYLRPDVLHDAGLTDFDTWAATFGEVTTTLELSPDGSSYRMQSRFAKFRNVPELLRMWHLSADIKTAEDLALPTPALSGGAASTVVVAPSPELTGMMSELSARADRVQTRQVNPAEDNRLRVASHGRMAALDLRLLGRDAGDPTKLVAAADRIAAVHARTAGNRYLAATGPAPCSWSSATWAPPGTAGTSTTSCKLCSSTAACPPGRSRSCTTAATTARRASCSRPAAPARSRCCSGPPSGWASAPTSRRAVALHHLDCPWRPVDLAQREGRLLRQGNLNDHVEIHRYVCERSFDVCLRQTAQRKARFIGQVMRGTLDVRKIEDIGDTALSYSEVKALATGDPRILDKARADADTARLERLERAHSRTRHTLHGTIERAEQRLPVLHREVALLERAAAVVTDTRGDHFTMTIGGRQMSARSDAATALRETLLALPLPHRTDTTAATPFVHLAGLTVLTTALHYPEPHLRLQLDGVPRSGTRLDLRHLPERTGVGLVTRLANRANTLPATRTDIEQEIARLVSERDRAIEQLPRPFPHADALSQARSRSAALAAELTNPPSSTPPARPEPAPPDSAQQGPAPPPQRSSSPAQNRWQAACAVLDPRLVDDPHWAALTAALDRADQAGVDVAGTLSGLFAGRPLPDQHPARELHHRLVGVCAVAATPVPPAAGPAGPASGPAAAPAAPPAPTLRASGGPPTGGGRAR